MTTRVIPSVISPILFAMLLLAAVASAQQNGLSVSFPDGDVSIFFRTLATASASRIAPEGSILLDADRTGKDNRAHRIISDRSSGRYFGYDVIVRELSDPRKFRVSIKALSVSPPAAMRLKSLTAGALPKYPPGPGASPPWPKIFPRWPLAPRELH